MNRIRRLLRIFLYRLRLKRWFASISIKTFLVCLVISFLLWFFKYFNAEHTTTFDLPIAMIIQDTTSNFVSINKPPNSIKINVTGPGWSLLRYIFLPTKSLKLYLNNPLTEYSLKVKNLLPQISNLISDIAINYIVEDSIRFKYDTLVVKQIKILVDSTSISLGDNYRITSEIDYKPKTFSLTTPSNFIENYPDTYLIKIPNKGIQKNFNRSFKITYSSNPLTTINRSWVDINFKVQAFQHYASFIFPKLKHFPKYATLDTSLETHVHYLIPRNKDLSNVKYLDTIEVELDYRKRDRRNNIICPKYSFLDTLLEGRVIPECFKIIKNDRF